MVGYSDRRHDCDDEVSYHDDLDEGAASGSEDCLVMFSLLHNLFVFRPSSVVSRHL